MSMLALKAWRDMLAHKGQFIALIVLVALGITSFVTFQNSYYDLRGSLDYAYERMHFSDATASVDKAPFSVARRLEDHPEILAARVRTVRDVGLERGRSEDRATARLVSIDDTPGKASVNDVYVETGRYPTPESRDEVVLHTKFSVDTGTAIGDTLTLRIEGQRRNVRVVGLGTDPENLYPLRGEGDLPSPGDFAVVYVPEHTIENLLGTRGSGNHVAVRAPEMRPERLADLLEDELEPYGFTETILRADQPSFSALEGEVAQNRVMARTLPVLVLAISAMSLFIALSRLVTAQRGEIGLAKAMGYSDGQIMAHYLSYALIIGTGGSVLGVALGLAGARGVAGTYTGLLGLPFLQTDFYPSVVAIALAIAGASCVVAALVPAINSARLAPAIAMHADPNRSLAGGRISLVERVLGPLMPRSFTFLVPLRNTFRARRRSLYTVLGIAFAMVLSVATVAMFDSMDYLLEDTFEQVELWDIAAVFDAPQGEPRANEIRRLTGVERVQPALVLPVTLKANDREESVSVTAMRPEADFHGFTNPRGASPADTLRANQLVLSVTTAQSLGVGTGSLVEVDSPLSDKTVRMRVGSLSEETLGQPAFTSFDAARPLAGPLAGRYNAFYLDIEPTAAERIQDQLFDMPGAASVQVKDGLVERLKTLLELFNVFGVVLLGFGSALAFVVVYTTFTANVTERTREIATMRTIGEDNLRLTVMITLENLLIAVAALPLGIWLGVQATNAMFASFSTDAYTIRAYIYPDSVARICALMLVVVLLSEIPPVRRIFRLDLAEATKVME